MFADNPDQFGGSVATYTKPTGLQFPKQNRPEVLFGFDSASKMATLSISPAFTQSALSQMALVPKCEVVVGATEPSATETADVGEKITLSFPGKPDFILTRETPTSVEYFAMSPPRSQIPPLYRVAVSGRPGSNTAGYNGSFLRTLPLPSVRSPEGSDHASPVKISRAEPVRVRWNPSGASFFNIQLNDFKFEKIINCKVPDTGRFTVPVEFMGQIADSGIVTFSHAATSFAVLEGRRVTHLGSSFRANQYVTE